MEFILNEETVLTDEPPGITVLDFVRYRKDLKGTKIGCREGDCGACTILVGELLDKKVRYRSMTSCLMPLANAAGKHIVTIEGVNPADGSLTPVQRAMVDESGTQCGFCTVGFVMSLTGFCVDDVRKTPEMAVSAIDGNICRCTGYKSIEKAAQKVASFLSEPLATPAGQLTAERTRVVPGYFAGIGDRLSSLRHVSDASRPGSPHSRAITTGGGTDLYVQRPEHMAEAGPTPLLYKDELRGVTDAGEYIEIGGSATVTDLLESPVMQSVFPDLYRHLKLVSSTPIRNMATLAGNFVNASPIGDMTVWFLALDAEITLAKVDATTPPLQTGVAATSSDGVFPSREMELKDLYLGYKQLAKDPNEIITTIRFRKPTAEFRFNFEKVSKRTYLDIASVNTAISFLANGVVLSEVHVSAGGVAPIPLYLKETSGFLSGREIRKETIAAAKEIMQSEISPISDVRGSAEYKRLLLTQLFAAHFVELFDLGVIE
jgi:xanthine dehydrogenase small subunit